MYTLIQACKHANIQVQSIKTKLGNILAIYSQCMQNYAKYRKYKATYASSYLKLWPDLANLLNLSVDMVKSCKIWVRLIIMQYYSQTGWANSRVKLLFQVH